MARQWRVFFRGLQPLLKWMQSKLRQRNTRIAVWGLAFGVLLSIGFTLPAWLSSVVMQPVVAQVTAAGEATPCPPISSPTAVPTPKLVQCARRLYDVGNFKQSAEVWQQAADTYKRNNNSKGAVNEGFIEALVNQAKALQASGLYDQALDILREVDQTLKNQPDNHLKLIVKRNYGDVLQFGSNLEDAKKVLNDSLTMAQNLHFSQDAADIELSLGNIARTQQQKENALTHYQNAANEKSALLATKIQAQLSWLHLLVDSKEVSDAKTCIELRTVQDPQETCRDLTRTALTKLGDSQNLWPQIFTEIDSLKRSHPTWIEIYDRISLAQNLMQLAQILTQLGVSQPQSLIFNSESEFIKDLLVTAVEQAKTIGNERIIAYALGNLGELYKRTGQPEIAEPLIAQALSLAQANNAFDIAYRWQWQLGQILKGKGGLESRAAAIAYYGQAVENLKALRGDLVATNQDIQFSYKESVEPVYREFVDLLLQNDKKNYSSSQEDLKKAQEVIESLQLAELDNFFRAACLEPKQQLDDVLDREQTPPTAVIYSIILEDRLEIILKLPKKPLIHKPGFTTFMKRGEVENILNSLLTALEGHDSDEVKEKSQKVYKWLIQPLEQDLEDFKKSSSISKPPPTLMFVSDGSLRKIPMTALYDGQHYLLEKYAVAVAPSLQLFDLQPLPREKLKVLAAAISKEISVEGIKIPFSQLPNTLAEVEEIENAVSSTRIVKLDDDRFTESNLQQRIQLGDFSVVHMATHGQFSSDPKKTYLLIHSKLPNYGELLNIEGLRKLLQISDHSASKIELLVLSACRTAEGDDRAILGLAGVAVRAGARSTLSTLWKADDRATKDLMKQFYGELVGNNVTKAEALRRAQLALMNTQIDPTVWAPYVLVGNWL